MRAVSRFDEIDNIKLKLSTRKDLVDHFGEDELCRLVIDWLVNTRKFASVNSSIFVCEETLFSVVLDYCSDILRLKNNHEIDNPIGVKRLSYESYWMMRRKPLRLKPGVVDHDAVFINERFVMSRVMRYLAGKNDQNIRAITNNNMNFLYETLFYFLKYRKYDAHAIEMILLSFCAGIRYKSNGGDTGIMVELHLNDSNTSDD